MSDTLVSLRGGASRRGNLFKVFVMKIDVLVAEIGSTTTVVNAFRNLDSENPEFFAQGQAPTSVLEGDVRIGLQGAIDDLCKKMGIDSIEYDEMLATSSAAGGLKMTPAADS